MQIKLFLFDQNGDISGTKGKEMAPGKCRFDRISIVKTILFWDSFKDTVFSLRYSAIFGKRQSCWFDDN